VKWHWLCMEEGLSGQGAFVAGSLFKEGLRTEACEWVCLLG